MKRTSLAILPPNCSPTLSEIKKAKMDGRDFQSISVTASNQNSNLSRLVESDMYFEARQRSFTHPHECFPIVYRENPNEIIHQTTALGIACRKFSTKTCSNSVSVSSIPTLTSISSPPNAETGFRCVSSPPGKRYNTVSSEMQQIELIQALYRACPYQIRCNQMKSGHTPLLDCVTNPNCTFEVRKFMIDGDCHLGLGDIKMMAMAQTDSNRLLPLHHLINQVRRNAVIAPNNESALRSMHYMIYRCPQLLTDERLLSSESVCISPLIHLLSQKVGSRHQGEAFMKPIVSCAGILLEASPQLIGTKSVMSKCSPLHMALRNGYGDFDQLILLLLRHDPMGHQVQSMNMFGDLPVHVAATVGVKETTWRLLLDHMVLVAQLNREASLYDTRVDPILSAPCACIWSMNKKGLTPLHLMWMRQINGDQVKYPNSSRQMGRLDREAFYHDALESAIRDIVERKKSRPLTATAQIASEVLGPFWDNLCIFLQGILLAMTPKSPRSLTDQRTTYNSQGFYFLHSIYALSSPYLPRPFLDLGLVVYPDQANKLDLHGRLPLHYACSSHAVFNEKIPFRTTEGNEGWKEVQIETGQAMSLSLPNDSLIQKLIHLNPCAAGMADKYGLLPLAYAIGNEKIWLKMKDNIDFDKFCARRSRGHCVLNHTKTIKQLVNIYPEALARRNPNDLFEWFMVAAQGSSSHLDTVYYLLRQNPVVLENDGGAGGR